VGPSEGTGGCDARGDSASGGALGREGGTDRGREGGTDRGRDGGVATALVSGTGGWENLSGCCSGSAGGTDRGLGRESGPAGGRELERGGGNGRG